MGFRKACELAKCVLCKDPRKVVVSHYHFHCFSLRWKSMAASGGALLLEKESLVMRAGNYALRAERLSLWM